MLSRWCAAAAAKHHPAHTIPFHSPAAPGTASRTCKRVSAARSSAKWRARRSLSLRWAAMSAESPMAAACATRAAASSSRCCLAAAAAAAAAAANSLTSPSAMVS